ncbi:plasmid stabilization protein [Streptomyces sp. RFCAC02]|uniref:FitA-like ribbon-helix-helix domain-containing protein n=1 Tax=Streptomyces sp. RFCAC02 TaxID=2499143 RepID=UPI00101E9497|nr:plasmid stabilization protein [Streptomyces sp. RFCAC02]
MATLTIRGLDDATHARLRVQAARHGRSMEAEVRAILSEQLTPSSPARPLGSRIRERFAGLGGAELETPVRQDAPRPAAFE